MFLRLEFKKRTPMKVLKLDPCEAPFWARGAHRQTILAHLIPSATLPSKGEQIELHHEDGDRSVAYVARGNSNVVIYLFHGLTGSVDSSYMHRAAAVARAFDHTVIMVNHRGCGEGVGMARNPYHSGRAEDLSTAIVRGRKNFTKARHIAIGFSLSANALLLLLGGARGTEKPDAAIAVNAPIDLEFCSRSLTRGLNRIYDSVFVGECKREIKVRPLTQDERRRYQVPRSSTLYDFDRIYTAPAGGFASREQYYQDCSAGPWLGKIKTPTIILTSADDPFVGVDIYRNARPSPFVQLHIENTGGHMGYLSKRKNGAKVEGPESKFGVTRWLDQALAKGIKALTDV
jgi:predicted alpha/beta-fold hydrolase